MQINNLRCTKKRQSQVTPDVVIRKFLMLLWRDWVKNTFVTAKIAHSVSTVSKGKKVKSIRMIDLPSRLFFLLMKLRPVSATFFNRYQGKLT